MHNVNILYLIIDVPTDNTDDAIVPRCGERKEETGDVTCRGSQSLWFNRSLQRRWWLHFSMPGSSANLGRGREDFKTRRYEVQFFTP